MKTQDWLQLILMLCSCGGIMLLTSKNPRTRVWGCFIGFCGQPFWFWTAKLNGQWGIMLMAFWYAFCYARGFFANRPPLPAPDDWSVLDSPDS